MAPSNLRKLALQLRGSEEAIEGLPLMPMAKALVRQNPVVRLQVANGNYPEWQMIGVIVYAVARVQVANVLEPTQQTLENPKMW